jgi:hypothetical protein
MNQKSDLKVRHRQDAQTTSRLTMESLIMASKYRDALSHVALLKRELAILQTHAMVLQTTSSLDSAEIYANNSFPANHSNLSSPETITSPRFFSTHTQKSSITSSTSTEESFPVSASPVRHDNHHEDDSSTMALPTISSHLDQQQREQEQQKDEKPVQSLINERLNVFEASFQQVFPSTFEFSSPSSAFTSKDAYDPFFASPERPQNTSTIVDVDDDDDDKNDEAYEDTIGILNTSPPPSPPASYQKYNPKTPPKNITEEDTRPPKPEKTPSAEARARFERALRPRTSITSNQTRTAATTSTTAKPSPLLQRIQEKRILKQKQQISSPSNISALITNTNNNNHHLTESSTLEESSIKPLNENSPSTRHSKRGVQKPISYAEPALNTKLRQGHVYFEKKDDTIYMSF